MRVLIINQTFHPDSSATSQLVTDFALFLVQIGHSVEVVCDRRGYENRHQVFARRETFRKIRITRLSTFAFGKRSFLRRGLDAASFFFLLSLKLWKTRADLTFVFTSPPLLGSWVWLFHRRQLGRLIHWTMDFHPDTLVAAGKLKENSILLQILREVVAFTLSHCEKVIVLDRWMKTRAVRLGVPEDKLIIVPPWPVLPLTTDSSIEQSDSLRSTLTPEEWRARYGVEGKFVILYSGNHSLLHPLDTLLEAARHLHSTNRYVFMFVGEGVRKRDVKCFAQEHKLGNIIQLPRQPRENLDRILALGDLHVVVMGNQANGVVHTSKIYGVLRTGRPFAVIGPRKSHLGDVLAGAQSGFQVEHGEVLELCSQIEKLNRVDPVERQRAAENNRTIVSEFYSREKSMQQLMEKILLQDPSLKSKLRIA